MQVRQLYRRRCFIRVDRSRASDVSTIRMHIWTMMRRKGSVVSRFFLSRRGWETSHFLIRRVMWISPRRWSARFRCLIMQFLSSVERTVCRDTPAHSGGFCATIIFQRFCLLIRWILRVLTMRQYRRSLKENSRTAVWILRWSHTVAAGSRMRLFTRILRYVRKNF